jgi:hypothetical protein
MPAMTLRIPPDILAPLDELAREQRRSRTAQILILLARGVREASPEPTDPSSTVKPLPVRS